MMISPATYREDHKKDSLHELIKERNRLLKFINDFEATDILHTKEISQKSSSLIISPGPDVKYQMYNEYLVEITKLINKEFNKQIWSERI